MILVGFWVKQLLESAEPCPAGTAALFSAVGFVSWKWLGHCCKQVVKLTSASFFSKPNMTTLWIDLRSNIEHLPRIARAKIFQHKASTSWNIFS